MENDGVKDQITNLIAKYTCEDSPYFYDMLLTIYQQNPIPTLILRTDDNLAIECNNAMVKLTGYMANEVDDLKDWLCRIYPEEEYLEVLLRFFLRTENQSYTTDNFEVPIRSKNGKEHIVTFYIHDLRYNGGPSGVHIIQAVDITYSRQIEQELKNVNESLHRINNRLVQQISQSSVTHQDCSGCLTTTLTEGVKVGVWTIDFVTGKMHYSPHDANILGYTLDELGETSEFLDKMTHPDDLPKLEKAIMDHYKGVIPYYEREFRLQTKDRSWKWFLEHGIVDIRDENEKPLRAIGTHVDISKLKRMEADLHRSEEKFWFLIENIPFAMALIKTDQCVEYVNSKFKELFGYTRVNFPHLNKWFQKLLISSKIDGDPAAADPFQGRMPNLHTSQAPGTTMNISTRNKEEKTIELKKVLLKSGRMLLIFLDKTEQNEIEKRLTSKEEELNQKLAEINEMDAAMRILLKSKEKDKAEIEENIMYNMKNLVVPYIEKLENSHLDAQQRFNLKMLKQDIQRVISPFSRCLSLNQINLTPTEIQVANLIKEGKITKEISSAMHISASAVEFHRYNIRKKLNLVNRKVNLRTYLQSL